MHLILQQDQPDDYVIATGVSSALEAFVDVAFAYFGLDWRDHTVVDMSLFRPTDISVSKGNATKAKKKLSWQATSLMTNIVPMMIEERLKQKQQGVAVLQH